MRSQRRSHRDARRLRRPRGQMLEVERLEGRLVLAANGLPDLHSLLGAPTAIYLDFDGHGSTLGAYDVDGDPTTFNAAEAATITEAHRQVSVYYAMFDINVTTVKPNLVTVPTAWIVISNDVVGGTSFVGVFPNTQPQSWIDSASARTRASGIAHEVGHNLGLIHQSDYDLQGNKTSEYSNGTDDLHGALMGVDYRQDVNKWTLGHPSSSASALQDDIAVIAATIKKYQPTGGDGFRADDFGGTVATATPLTLTAGGRSTTGIIERMSDVDTFSFTTSNTGAVISVVPTRPSGLDAKVEVFDATGMLIAARDGDANEQQIVVPAGTGTWYVSISSHGNYGDLGTYDLTVNDLPAGWASADIGTTGLQGDAKFSGGTYTVEGAGAAVGGTADAFRFAWQQLTGDGSIVARVTQNQNTNARARAGVEIRESLAANSKHVALVTTATQGLQLLSRSTTGGSTAAVNGTAAAFTATWVLLVRVGNVITASHSADGTTWTTVGSVTVSMGATVSIGLLGSATDAAKLNAAKFTNVSLTGTLNAPETLNELAAPTGVAIAQGGGASFVVSWQPVAGATGYAIERSSNGVDFTGVFTAASSATSWTNTGLAGSMRYFYRVRATTAAARSAASAIVSAINRPSPVTEAAVTVLSNSHLVLNWIDTSGETGYRIERSTDNVSFAQIATIGTNLPSYSVSGLAAGTPYWFRISPMSPTGDGNPVVITGRTTGFQAVVDLAFTSKASSALGIEWSAVSAATNYRIERSTNGTSFTTLATVAAGTLTYTDATVAVLGKYYYRVVAINGTTVAEPSPTIFTAAPRTAALPEPWIAADIGSVGGDGATGLQSSTFILVSSGTAIGGPADSFRSTYQPLVGDGSIIARVSTLENTNGWAKAGVMIRESNDANARQAVMVVSPTNGIAWQYRHNIGGNGVTTVTAADQIAPVWLRLVRAGNTFTGSWSSDGVTWIQAGSTTISMGPTAVIGLVSTSGAATLLNRAEFTNVTVSNLAPTVIAATATPGTVTGSTAILSVLGADDHGEPNLRYGWTAQGPAAVTFSDTNTNAAKSSVATFSRAGSYTLTATITDSSGLTAATTVNVTVAQTLTAIAVSPETVSLVAGLTQQFSASATDQFGNPLTTQPSFTWAVTGGGSITTTGLFTAAATAGTSTVTASALSVTGQAAVTITSADQVVTVAAGQDATDTGGRSGIGKLFKRGAGRLVLAGSNAHSGGIVVEAGELVIRNPASLGSGVLEVRAGGRVTLDAGAERVSVARLELSSGGTFDLASGSVLLTPGSYDLAGIRGLILNARGNRSWSGPGITSTSIQPGTPFEVGYRALQDGSLVVGYSGVGDANMDGRVDDSDVTAVSSSGKYGSAGADAAWWHGDFNYDGVVNIKDLVSLRTSGLYGSGSYLPSIVASASSVEMVTAPMAPLTSTTVVAPLTSSLPSTPEANATVEPPLVVMSMAPAAEPVASDPAGAVRTGTRGSIASARRGGRVFAPSAPAPSAAQRAAVFRFLVLHKRSSSAS
jgi:autotransporter-associated beta strand protein